MTDLFGFAKEEKIDTKYSTSLATPQYTPTNDFYKIADLVDDSKYNELVRNINASTVTDEEKQFLLLSATRHLKFNYSRIADYYCNQASKEMQELMEQSALVIVDFNSALKNGFVQLTQQLEKIMRDDKRLKGDTE